MEDSGMRRYLGGDLGYSKGQSVVVGFLALVTMIMLMARHPAQAETTILAFGDSLTAGYGLPPEQGFTGKLAAALSRKAPVAVVNGGVSGDTTAGGLDRLDWSLADRPDAVILELGANDMLRGTDPAEIYRNLDKILTRLKASNIPVLLCGMKSVGNWGGGYQSKFDAIYLDLARKYDVPLYPFFLDGVALTPTLLQADGMHPNAAGVDIIVQHILPSVQQLIAPHR